jgi:Ca2+/H+ antiporter, TMEM165/GDT1 family
MHAGVTLSLLVATFAAAFVEFVEALTIVLAMGSTRGWRSTMWGVAAAVGALAAFTAAAGYALTTWLPETLLQLVIGSLLLVFGLQWLRKAVLRSSGLLATRDEDAAFARQTAAAAAGESRTWMGLDWLSFVVSFKGVFLEGVEVVFIVITFGLNADNVPVAVIGATAAGVVVVTAGALVHRPLARVPENTLKYGVGLMLATFGTFWSVEGLGIVRGDRSLEWPGGALALVVLLAVWLGLSRLLVRALPRLAQAPAVTGIGAEGAAGPVRRAVP